MFVDAKRLFSSIMILIAAMLAGSPQGLPFRLDTAKLVKNVCFRQVTPRSECYGVMSVLRILVGTVPAAYVFSALDSRVYALR
jgi:hypothetical protein